MKNTLDFLIKSGKLKQMPRRGWVLRGLKNKETIASHTFRTTLMAWILCRKKKLNMSKVLKMALIHDLCEIYAGDTTPYDKILLNKKNNSKDVFNEWIRFSKKEKEKFFRGKYKKEEKALKKLVIRLPLNLKKEIVNLWNEYEKALTPEGRFVRQLDRVENLLQSLEYWQEGKSFKIEPWWIQIEELIDDPVLLDFIKALEKKFYQSKKK